MTKRRVKSSVACDAVMPRLFVCRELMDAETAPSMLLSPTISSSHPGQLLTQSPELRTSFPIVGLIVRAGRLQTAEELSARDFR